MDMITGVPGVFFGTLSFGVLYQLIQSMTANSIRAGWGQWVPEWLLVKLTEWVKEEIETKISHSSKRKKDLKTNDLKSALESSKHRNRKRNY